jgi:hypothetical protein
VSLTTVGNIMEIAVRAAAVVALFAFVRHPAGRCDVGLGLRRGIAVRWRACYKRVGITTSAAVRVGMEEAVNGEPKRG